MARVGERGRRVDAMRRELRAIVDTLIVASERSREVTIDAIGNAIGVLSVSSQEVDEMITVLERANRRVVGKVNDPATGSGENHLKAVVAAARALGPALGRKPTAAEIATHAGITADEVRHALSLLEIMQR